MKRSIVGALVGALLLLGGGAQAATAMTTPFPARAADKDAGCSAERVGSDIVVSGVGYDVATSAHLVCHVYVDGFHVAAFGGSGAGPVAVVLARIANAPPGPVATCSETRTTHLDGTTAYKYCP